MYNIKYNNVDMLQLFSSNNPYVHNSLFPSCPCLNNANKRFKLPLSILFNKNSKGALSNTRRSRSKVNFSKRTLFDLFEYYIYSKSVVQ